MLKSILTTKKARIPEMEFHSEKLKNPEFFCENRLPAHSDHEAFACLEDLEAVKPPADEPEWILEVFLCRQ